MARQWPSCFLPTCRPARVLADKGLDADWIRDLIEDKDCTPHIPPRRHRCASITYSKRRYKQRNLIEHYFDKLKQFRQSAMHFDRNPLNYLAMIKLNSIRLWLRVYKSGAKPSVAVTPDRV